MDARHLAVLREVAEHGSVTEAARVLHLTPSAVSQQLKTLEAVAGTPLIERVGRGIRVTPAGHELAKAAVDVAVAIERAAATCARYAAQPVGTVRVAAFQSAGQMLFPGLLSAIADDDGVIVECGEQDVAQSQFAPLTSEYDIVIAHRPDRSYAWAVTAELRVVPLLREPMDIALPAGHPLAGKATLRPSDLAGERWITVQDGFPIADIVHAIANKSGAPLQVAHRINDFHVTETLVAAGHGIALLPRYTANPRDGTRFVLRPIDDVPASREIDALLRPDRYERIIVRNVLQALQAAAAAIIDS